LLLSASRWLRRALGAVFVVYALAAVGVFFGQAALIYYPDDRPLEACNLPDGVHFWRSGKERGVLADFDQPRLLVFFHGNADSACSWRFLGVNHLVPLGYDVLVVEYPGYRGDPRRPSRAGIEGAVRSAGDWVATQNYEGVVAMGYSLGTGAAALFARDYPVDQVILFAPYDSVYNVAWERGFVFPRMLLREDFDNMQALRQVPVRIDILHGAEDAVIPVKHSANLSRVLRGAGRNVHYTVLDGVGHQGLFASPAFDIYMRDVLSR